MISVFVFKRGTSRSFEDTFEALGFKIHDL